MPAPDGPPPTPPSLWPALHRLATGEDWPPSSPEAVKPFLARAIKEGLFPLLFAQQGLPAAVREALDRIRPLVWMSARRAEIMFTAMRQLGEVLRDEPFAFLKGADYAHRLYARPALRPMGDLDILVSRERMNDVTRTLLAGGLVSVFTGAVTELPWYHERLFRLGEVSIDVHHSFIQRSRNRVDYDGVWARKVLLEAPGVSAYRLSDVDAFVYHAFAMAVDEFWIPLSRYVDLWLMARADGDIWERAVERAREWGVERALYGSLRLASRTLPELGELGVHRALERLLTPSARRFLDGWVLPDSGERARRARLPRTVQLWRKLWLMDGLRHRAAFALYHGYAVLATARRPRGGPAAPAGGGLVHDTSLGRRSDAT